MRDRDTRTGKVITWTLSHPVLALWLARIARDELTRGDDELMCTVVDLLDPGRGHHAAAFLHAVGVPAGEADALHAALSEGTAGHWLALVDWPHVRRTLLDTDKDNAS